MRQSIVLLFIVVLGVCGFLVFGAYAVIDYAALQRAYAQFEHAAQSAGTSSILITEARQNIYRINVFAEGVWALLSLLIAAVGLHGMCVKTRRTP